MNHLKCMVGFLIILSIAIAYSFVYSAKYNVQKPDDLYKKNETIFIMENPLKKIKTFTITAVGDCTIGWDTKFGTGNRFDTVFKKNNKDYGYFFKLVKSIFEDDDLTYANFEGTLTNETVKVEKKFNFKATPDYVNVLKEGNIEVVGLANNHSYDYGDKALEDTKNTLKENNIDYFGASDYLIKEVNGLKIGFFGLIDIPGRKYNQIDKALNYLKEQNCDLIIAAMHWGIESDYNQSSEQIKEGHYLIDNGVDLVIGTHPHVIQGIEKYKDRYIIYSLANFSFGGNPNPKDKDTFIYRQTFTFIDNKLVLDDNIEVIPASVSSITKNNNYQPTVVVGEKRNKILQKINKNSNVEFK
ncbi:MAG: CapA family protein [Bacilli bacterium]|nr:CapA family protein [Bacilli bacterium]